MKNSENYKLGSRVAFSKDLKRCKHLNDDNHVLWATREYDKLQEGIICGKRNIHYRGRVVGGWGEPYEFDAMETIQVVLVATNMAGFHRVRPEWLIPIVDIEMTNNE